MSDKEHIRSLIREAELYRKQGLIEESKEKYEEILHFLQGHERYSKDKKLIDAVQVKIRTVEGTLDEIESAPETPELSQEMHELISRLFSFSKNKNTAAMEGAIALAKFGQYDKAIKAFQELIQEGNMPLVAAKNALMCHMNLASADAAVAQLKQWLSQETFSAKELRYLRATLRDHLAKRGIEVDLPQVREPLLEKIEPKQEQEAVIDISSFAVHLANGPSKGHRTEFEVSFQSGNTVSTIIAAKEKDVVDAFKPGLQLPDIECFSPIAVFKGRGVVSSMKQISSGRRKGDYSLDISIEVG
jgi:tetratricopeptide (TPR) repeat protein